MKKTILTLALLISGLTMSAQTVNDILIEDIPSVYITVNATPKPMKPMKVMISCDYGQMSKISHIYKLGALKDVDGNPMVFNGDMPVLNLFESKGFEFVSREPNANGGYTYLLKKSN
jgi:hypothetical protein